MALSSHKRIANVLDLPSARISPFAKGQSGMAEPLSYNGLVQNWPEITRLAREGAKARTEKTALFEETEE